ncbi:hypothetical protein IKF15_00240 [Candidatus Saccharibacteria bacterium]|nr:hypothetical protein [Candidatus Saccharibacteria bacterium]
MKDNKKSKTLAKKPEAPKFKIGQEVFFPVSGSPEKWIIQQSKIVGLTYDFMEKTGEIVHTGYTMASCVSNERQHKGQRRLCYSRRVQKGPHRAKEENRQEKRRGLRMHLPLAWRLALEDWRKAEIRGLIIAICPAGRSCPLARRVRQKIFK